jgi:hypothetical protein
MSDYDTWKTTPPNDDEPNSGDLEREYEEGSYEDCDIAGHPRVVAPEPPPPVDPAKCPWCGCETRLQRGRWEGHRKICPLRP